MRLFSSVAVRRCAGLALLLFFAIPFGLSVTGCGHKAAAPQFCYGGDSGPVVGQLTTITLNQSLAVQGESLNYGQIGPGLSATGTDCKGNSVSLSHIVYATTDMSIADINPASGQTCGGTWNRNTGGGIADYTTCTPPAASNRNKYLAYVTATSDGITSNAIPVYVHATVTGIVFGKSSAGSCSTDPDTTCCPASPTTVKTAPYYDGSSCVSQNQLAQVAARVYTNNTTNPADNITCKAGHLAFTAEGASGIVSLDPNGVATAGQPGSVVLSAGLSNSANASTIGFFSTCAPASITLAPVGTTSNGPISVALNNTQSFTATAIDTKGNPLTGLALEFESSSPQTIPASAAGSVTPAFPGAATITAVCQPPSCNPAPFSQLGYLGNGKPVTSNGIQVTTAGSSSTVLIVGSTQSQYIFPVDLTTGLAGALVKLPYVPNSMILSQDGSTLYMGSSGGLMTLSTSALATNSANQSVQGQVLSVSPDGSTLVTTDPSRNTVSLIATSSGGGVLATTNGVGTHAQWSPDSQTVYITTTGNTLLTHSSYTQWQSTPISGSGSADQTYSDVAVMVPAIGAYFAGSPSTDGRTYCSLTTRVPGSGIPPTENNLFAPLADAQNLPAERVTATVDGNHILGASSTTGVSDIFLNKPTSQVIAGQQPNGPQSCTTVPEAQTVKFTTSTAAYPFAGIAPAQITGVDAASNSALAFITFNGSGNAKLPFYVPNSSSPNGSLGYFSLSTAQGTPQAPVAGVFSTDNLTFFVGTSGDNVVHQLAIKYPASGAPQITDAAQIVPQLPLASGSGTATPNLIVQRPKKQQS